MKYEVKFTSQFKKDLKQAKKQHKDTEKLYAVIEKLANGEPLEEKYRDHDLTGNYKGCRECHVEPDWLLIYEIDNGVLVLMLYRVGSHSELFKKSGLFRLERPAFLCYRFVMSFTICRTWSVCSGVSLFNSVRSSF